MPIIPRLQAPGPLNAAPAPVLDRERRPTVDSSREIAAVGALGKAGQMPLDNNDYTLRGMGAVGDAVMRAGSVMGAMANKAIEEKSRTALIEAQTEMDVANDVNGAFYSQNRNNTDAWVSQASKTAEDLKSRLLKDERLTRTDRERLGVQLDSWSKKQIIHAQTNGAAVIYANSKASLTSRIESLRSQNRFDELPPLMDQAKASGTFYEWELEDQGLKTEAAMRARDENDLENRYKMSVMGASPEELESVISDGKAKFNWTDTYAEAKRMEGMEGIEKTKTINAAKTESEFLGDILMRRAQGEVFTPEQVDKWVADKVIDKETGSRLRVVMKSDVGALSGEFMDFLTKEVDSYDPDADPDGLKMYELNKKSDLLGLNDRQRELYAARFNRAAKVNADPRLKPLEAVRRAAKTQIGEAFKDLAKMDIWRANLSGALQDSAKLEAWGIDASKRKEIISTIRDTKRSKEDRNQAALRIFQEASKGRESKSAEGLSKYEFDLYQRAEKDEGGSRYESQFEADFDRALLEEGFDNWYDTETAKRGMPPPDVEVRKWVGEKIRSVLQGSNGADIFNTKSSAAVPSSTSSTSSTPATPGVIDEHTVSMIKDFESFIPEAYGDYKQISVGYGTRARFDGEVLTEPEADARLRDELQGHISRVDSLAERNGVNLTEEQRSSLISFDFNTGAVHRIFERGGADTTKYAPIMKEWRNAGGKVLAGLVSRRAKEAAAFE